MKQGIQTDIAKSGLCEPVGDAGCYFLDLLQMAFILTGKDYTQNEIIAIYRFFSGLPVRDATTGKNVLVMEKDCFINDPLFMLNRLLDGKMTFKNIVKTAVLKTDPPVVVCSKKPMYTHFTLLTADGVWDSLDPTRPGRDAYKTDSYRVFTR
jgi:hypothetical protein